MTPATIFVIDDHALLREGIRMLLSGGEDVRFAGGSATASAAVPLLEQLHPDVVVLDLDLGAEDGLAWLPRISAAAPGAKVLILTAFRDRARDEEALRAGARGLVLKDAPPESLLSASRSVAAGALWVDPQVLAATGSGRGSRRTGPEQVALSEREREIVVLLTEGLRNEEVGRRLGISEKTVRNHLTSIFHKVGISGRLELVVYAFEHGLARPRR